MTSEPTVNNAVVSEELSQIKEQLAVMQTLLQQIQQKQSSLETDSQPQIIHYLTSLHSEVSKLSEELTLISPASGVDYTKLRKLLAEKKWKEADIETCTYMIRISEREGERWLDDGDIKRFPRHDLRIIDQLWVKYSGGKFGFSAQKRIWQDVKEDWKRFGDRVGWLKNPGNSEWRRYGDSIFTLSAAEGHLPYTVRVVGLGYRSVEELPHRLGLFLSRY